MSKEIFVFGSNLAGIHGAGASAYALLAHGAIKGIGKGMAGNSYALPTQDYMINTLKLPDIKNFVQEFIEFAEYHHTLTFKVTAVGCGIAGYSPELIGPMFELAPINCLMPPEWKHLAILKDKEFWEYASTR